jgi:hypothetical protein
MSDALGGFDLLDKRLKEIVIFHQDIPMVNDKRAVQLYLDCLVFSQDFWKKTRGVDEKPVRELRIIFPIQAREKILRIMDDYEICL